MLHNIASKYEIITVNMKVENEHLADFSELFSFESLITSIGLFSVLQLYLHRVNIFVEYKNGNHINENVIATKIMQRKYVYLKTAKGYVLISSSTTFRSVLK